jgi:death-on-curing protein
VKYLTPEQVLFIHARLIAETGGSHGIRDLGLLLSALARPQATFDGQDLHPDLFSKAGALMESLLQNHPFIDGNKRTAITASAMFLRLNGYHLTASNAELEQFTFAALLEHWPVDRLAGWFASHTVQQKA